MMVNDMVSKILHMRKNHINKIYGTYGASSS